MTEQNKKNTSVPLNDLLTKRQLEEVKKQDQAMTVVVNNYLDEAFKIRANKPRPK